MPPDYMARGESKNEVRSSLAPAVLEILIILRRLTNSRSKRATPAAPDASLGTRRTVLGLILRPFFYQYTFKLTRGRAIYRVERAVERRDVIIIFFLISWCHCLLDVRLG